MMDDPSSHPVIVLSGETTFLNRLQEESELPSSWFGDSLPTSDGSHSSHPLLVRINAESSTDEESPSLDIIDLTQWFIRLAGRLVVQILVINSDADTQRQSERFAELVNGMKQYMLERDTRVRFAVIVVDEGSGNAAPVLQQVNELRDSHSVDAVYVMTSLLEPRERFAPAARDVWPVAVGRLLFHWMHCPPPASMSVSPLHAWRLMSLPPESEQSLQDSTDRLVDSLMESIYDTVFRQPVESKRPMPIDIETLSQSVDSVSLDSEIPSAGPSPAYWTQVDVAESFRTRLADKRWQPMIAKLADQVVAHQESAIRETNQRLVAFRREQWQGLRDVPSKIHQLALRRDVDANLNTDRLESENSASAKMQQMKQLRDEAIATAARCAIEFELTQQGHVGTVYRIWPCVAVVMAVGYPVMAVTYGIFGSILAPALCGVATVLATGIAAWYSAELENRAGIRARQELGKMLGTVDQTIQQYNEASAKRFLGGSVIFAKTQSDQLEAHIRELAARGQSVISLTHTMQRQHGSVSRRDQLLAEQAHADQYGSELSLPLPFDLNVSIDEESWWKTLIDEQAQRFHQQVWQSALRSGDRYLAGNLLCETLSLRWQEYKQTLAPLLVTRVCRRQYSDASPDAITTWATKLERLQTLEREIGLLSCHVPSSAVGHDHDRPAAMMVLQNGFEAIADASTLPRTDLVHFDTPLDVLDQLPWLGYWFQHIPVAVTIIGDRLAVTHFDPIANGGSRPTGVEQS